METFREAYCAKHEIASELFEVHLLRRCLYPSARAFDRLFQLENSEYFTIDREIVRAVGDLTRLDCYADVVHEFRHHRLNRHWLRRLFHLRLSTTLLRQEVFAILGRRLYVYRSAQGHGEFASPAAISRPAAA